MENLILSKIYDDLVLENMGYNKKCKQLYCKICEKYKKSESLDDEDEISCDLAELVYLEQKRTFELGVKFAFGLFKEISMV